jgi:bisphosphoglycerate-dependent phosphoglycerate mutase
MERTIPLWENKIVYELMEGRNVRVVAHANTLRGLVKAIDNVGDAEIQHVAVPTGILIVYKFEIDAYGKLKSSPPSKEENSVRKIPHAQSEAGRLLKVHGFEFDVVYTSWLAGNFTLCTKRNG